MMGEFLLQTGVKIHTKSLNHPPVVEKKTKSYEYIRQTPHSLRIFEKNHIYLQLVTSCYLEALRAKCWTRSLGAPLARRQHVPLRLERLRHPQQVWPGKEFGANATYLEDHPS